MYWKSGEEKEERREEESEGGWGAPPPSPPTHHEEPFHRIDHIRQDGMEEFLNCLVAIAWVIALTDQNITAKYNNILIAVETKKEDDITIAGTSKHNHNQFTIRRST